MKEALVHYICAPDEGNLPPISWRTLLYLVGLR